MYMHVGTAWRLKGHNPRLKGFRSVHLHNVWWQQIPIPHCYWEKGHLSIRQDSSWNALLCVFLEGRQGGINLLYLLMDTSSLSMLYIIISLASFPLFAKRLHLSLWSMLLTLDRIFWLLTTYLAALLCTASILFISVFVLGFQTVWHIQPTGEQVFCRLVL
jgi:hypothetical protein